MDPANSEAVAAAMVLASLLLGDEGMGSQRIDLGVTQAVLRLSRSGGVRCTKDCQCWEARWTI